MSKRLYPILLFVFVLQNISIAQNIKTSVLAEGQIFKMAISQSGIYKLDYNFLSKIDGIDMANLEPQKIQIFSNPGGLIPQENNRNRIDDLNELSIKVVGGDDNSFDSGDYILFYAEAADKFNLESGEFVYEKNYYDLKNYIFLRIGVEQGSRIESLASLVNPEIKTDKCELAKRHEIDRINLLAEFGGTQGSGKQWFGESFANNRNQDFSSSFEFNNVVIGTEAQLKAQMTSRSQATAKFELSIDGQKFTSSHGSTNTGDIETLYAKTNVISSDIIINNAKPIVSLNYLPSSSDGEGWLDYIEIVAKVNLVYQNQSMFIADRSSKNYTSYAYKISASQNLEVWNISDLGNLHAIETSFRNNTVEFSFETDNTLKSFIAFNPSNSFPAPEYISKVSNQNLHGIEQADFVIVYHPDFIEAAEKLATHRTQNDGLLIRLVNIYDVYNEFGGGRSEATALKDFVRMIYRRDPNFNYLLLMGDASYDFRGINPNIAFQNFVPTYETDESLNPVQAFPSDDFFALLSDTEGDISLNGALDIAVGRIPCKTADEANGVVDKIIHYDTSKDCLGPWRLNTGYYADDVDKFSDNVHSRDTDEIARTTFTNHPEFIQQKVYWDAFTQVSTPGGQRYPDANAALNENIQKGQLVLTYLGHGGPKGWSQERVLQINDINSWTNINKLPLIITATCSFTGFDEPNFVSAGENAILNPRGGAVGLFTTVRAVYSSSNKRLTSEVYKALFERTDGQRRKIGDIIKEAKNANSADTTSSNARKFLLMGDPTMSLAVPKYNIKIDALDGSIVSPQKMDTLGALDRAHIAGSVADFDNNIISGFNGQIFITVYDKPTPRRTLDNDGQGSTFEFDVMKNILYKGSATVKNGLFEADIVIPKDINFDYGSGHISFYASDNISEDAGGYYNQLVIGGSSNNGIVDNEGPEINIYFDDRSFQFGGTTRKNPILILDLSDENGINLSSTSIGHDITAALEDKFAKSIILNDFYDPSVDEVGTGTVEYQLSELEPGLHSIYVKAWDILNNSSEAYSEFFVAENIEGFINNLFNYPNPVIDGTEFTFEHDLSNANLDISVNIYTISGQLVKTVKTNRTGAGYKVDNIYWDGRDGAKNKLTTGIYIYKINISSSELNLSRESDFQKLVILN